MANKVQTEISRLIMAKQSIADAITSKNIDVPTGAKIDALANYIRSIPLAQSACGTITGNNTTELTITHNLGRQPCLAVISVQELDYNSLSNNLVAVEGTFEFSNMEAEEDENKGFSDVEGSTLGGYLGSSVLNSDNKIVQFLLSLANYEITCYKDTVEETTGFDMRITKQVEATTTLIQFTNDYVFSSDKEYVYTIF